MEINSILTAIMAAIFTLLSPCILPVLPVYLSIITGFSFEDFKNLDQEKRNRVKLIKRTIFGTIFFIIGFSVIFIILASIFFTFSQTLIEYRGIIKKISGIIIVIFGFFILLQEKIKIFSREIKVFKNSRFSNNTVVAPFILGVSVSFGWTPCISPFLGSLLLIASSRETAGKGILLLLIYSLTLLLLFMIIGLIFAFSIDKFKRILRNIGIIKTISGIILILSGILLFFNLF